MKKILLVALMALCGASFSFGDSMADCVDDCFEVKRDHRSESECVGDCVTKAIVKAGPEGYAKQDNSGVAPAPESKAPHIRKPVE